MTDYEKTIPELFTAIFEALKLPFGDTAFTNLGFDPEYYTLVRPTLGTIGEGTGVFVDVDDVGNDAYVGDTLTIKI